MMYIIEYDNCEDYEDNRTWHSNKVFETKMQAIRFLIDEGFDVPKHINKDDLSFYKYFDYGLMYEAEIVEIEYVEDAMKNEWLPGDDIEAYGEWFTLVIEESKYYIAGSAQEHIIQYYRLLDEDYYLSDIIELEDLKKNYTNVSLEQGRLK